ncbi:iron uptake transporter permease EfeU [Kineococcus rhizosphaerae]|uniref:High-affinity iron transporter n=1 Tax=Kineococcus rhizosphaerae TaxID=559628 RepID=A0A2T0QZ95_9ACTN|nr:iron uptake transporter permease EfeU [Kineococcus rhizosphaerae]PRY11841.1 high-affinity iron transporter [Kineococcus rhizosphaerae]
MLATFVIGLREGLEASLIVGIVSAFLVQRGERRALRWVSAGVLLAVVLCVGAAAALQAATQSLPQRQQEQLETVLALVAVVMVTWMVVWTTRNARTMRTDLERSASSALARGSAWALVAMAFLAVLREGLETSVFLLATYQVSGSSADGAIGASLGVVLAVVLGYLIYRGGVRLNLGRLFRVTGVVLVLVAAGLVMGAAHTAHEAGWLLAGQATALDASAVVTPGTVRSALFTGVLGWQPRPTVVELAGWLVYLVPMLVVVLRPRATSPAPQRVPA